MLVGSVLLLHHRRRRAQHRVPTVPSIESHIDPFVGDGIVAVICGGQSGSRRNFREPNLVPTPFVMENENEGSNAPARNDNTTAQHFVSNQEDSSRYPLPSQEANLVTDSNNSHPPTDLLQLFENRAFEDQLLNLIVKRMDFLPGPTPPNGTVDSLPAYRPPNLSSNLP
jgi:hypothetical protein